MKRVFCFLCAAVLTLGLFLPVSADFSLIEIPLDGDKTLKNLFDPAEAAYGYINADHTVTASASHYSSAEIRVLKGDRIYFGPCNTNQGFHLMHWSADGAATTVRKAGLTELGTFDNGQVIYRYTVPAGGTISVVNASAYNDYFLVTKDQSFTVQEYHDFWDEKGGNLYKKLLDKQGAFLNADETGSYTALAKHNITHFISVKSGDTVSFGPADPAQAYHAMGFDSAKKNVTYQIRASALTVAGTLDDGAVLYNYTVPSGVSYIRVVNNTAYNDCFTVTRNDPLTPEKYYAMQGIHVDSPLYGKSALFVGDSICFGTQDSPRGTAWAGRIGRAYAMNAVNKGVSGASLSTARQNSYGRIVSQLTAAAGAEYDYVILHGGVNDAWDSYPVGTVSASFDPESFNTATYAGGLEETIHTAVALYGDHAAIGYLMNFRQPAASKGRVSDMSDYYAVGRQICEKWGIPYFDMYNHEEITAALQPSTTAFLPDYIHPNAKGYDLLTPYIASFMETLVPYAETHSATLIGADGAPRTVRLQNGKITATAEELGGGFWRVGERIFSTARMLEEGVFEASAQILFAASTGDANGDGAIDTSDVVVLTRALNGEAQPNVADADLTGDGRLSVADAVAILRLLSL